MGNLMVYTFMDGKLYDKLELIIDGKSAGALTLSNIKRPECNDPSSINVLNIKLTPGVHTWAAKQIKGGKEVDEWDERDVTIKEGECNFIKLTE